MFNVRLKFIAFAIFLMMAVILLRLGHMQVLMAEHYREEGRRRRIRNSYPSASRGRILARDGTVLAEDRPVLSICVVLRDLNIMTSDDIRKWYATPEASRSPYPWKPREGIRNWYAAVGAIVGEPPEGVERQVRAVLDDVEKQVAEGRRRVLSSGNDTKNRRERAADREEKAIRRREYRTGRIICEDIGRNEAFRAEVLSTDLPGLVVTQSMKRKYPRGRMAAHVLGYVSEINAEEVDLYRFDYAGDERKRMFLHDMIGRDGIEKQYDFQLRSSRGRLREIINVRSQPQVTLEDEPPEPGSDLVLSLDPDLQAAAERALGAAFGENKRAGAAVCMDVHSGEVLVLASSPGFDPNTFSSDYGKLIDPKGLGKFHPLQNRSTAGVYPLGSVFKIITTTAGLETGALSPTSHFTCNGVFKLGGSQWRCWISRAPYFGAHGSIDLLEAIKVSCNCYFYQAGLKTGGAALSDWARRFGFGALTDIDLPRESPGNVPTTRYRGDVVNLSIGQGSLLVTPLQVCRMVAAVANGGKLLAPRLNLDPDAPAGGASLVGFSQSTWETLREGLYNVVNVKGGTGYRVSRSRKVTIAGKTGTAQAPPDGEITGDHGWFAGFAPFENPEIAFAVVVEHGGHGGAVAGPVAKAIAEAYAEKGGAK